MDVSIIIPIYKGKRYLQKIDHMISKWDLSGEKNEIEIIFVNDYPDEVLDLTTLGIGSRYNVKYVENEKNIGIHASRIVGLAMSTREYVVFLDQDDTLSEMYFESQFRKVIDADAVICNGLWRNGENIFSESNPMRETYSFDLYLDEGYPLVSLGQLMIKRESIPDEWKNNILKYNGWDDHFLWALIMFNGVKVATNQETLYIHEEDGRNASFNWKQMSLSGMHFKKIFRKLKLMDSKQDEKFCKLISNKILKYDNYALLEKRWDETNIAKIEKKMYENNIGIIAIYGMGVYGKKLYENLQGTAINISYGIDRRKDVKECNLKIISPEEVFEDVDAVIVTPIANFEEIKAVIKEKCSCKVFSLAELL